MLHNSGMETAAVGVLLIGMAAAASGVTAATLGTGLRAEIGPLRLRVARAVGRAQRRR